MKHTTNAHLQTKRITSIAAAMIVLAQDLRLQPLQPANAPVIDEPQVFPQDDAPATPGPHFAGLLSPAGRTALAEELHEATSLDDEGDDAGRSRFASERGLAANIVARRIQAARELNGFTQTELAKMLGYRTSAQLSQWEGGVRPPPLPNLIALSDALCVSADFLLGRHDDPERDSRAVRRNSCLRAVRVTLAAAAERIADAFDSSERVLGAGIADVRALVEAANACTAHANGARGSKALSAALDRLEGAALKVALKVRQYDDEDSRQRARLAEIAANDAG